MIRTSLLSAVQHVRRMRGGSQAHLLRASDGQYYVTKFQNNPQHIRVLANEFFANRLGILLGLPIPEPQLIEVSEDFIRSAHLQIEVIGHCIPCESGLHLGLRYVVDPEQETIFEYLPDSMFKRVANIGDFARMLAFDKWVGNCDSRQAIFTRKPGKRLYCATFIDQGFCFNAEQWTFPDLALHGVYSKKKSMRMSPAGIRLSRCSRGLRRWTMPTSGGVLHRFLLNGLNMTEKGCTCSSRNSIAGVR